MEINYESFTADQFLDDDFFIQWIKGESYDANDFWNKWIGNNPANLEEMRSAEQQLRAILSAKRIIAGKSDKDAVWTKIENSIHATPSKVRKITQRWWWAAAAILILMAGGYFLLNQGQPNKEIAVVSNNIPVNDIAPGGNKATLTLANGTTIILDSAQNGTLTQQGNIKIIKLDDGQLAYDQSVVTNKEEILYNTISTPRGGQYQMTLSDGSKVWLNAESSLRFPASFTGNERKVELAGEGYFEVAHNAEKPFHVSVNGADVQVLGTHFNVNAYGDEGVMKTTLLEGSVILSKGDKSVKIIPGEQASIDESSKIIVNKDVNLNQVIAWKNGKFYFQDASLDVVMRQLEKWYDVSFVNNGDGNKEEYIGIVSRNVNISQILQMLEKTGSAKFEIQGRRIIVK